MSRLPSNGVCAAGQAARDMIRKHELYAEREAAQGKRSPQVSTPSSQGAPWDCCMVANRAPPFLQPFVGLLHAADASASMRSWDLAAVGECSPELAAACEVWKEIDFEVDTIGKL